MMKGSLDTVLRQLYYDISKAGGFGGVDRLYRDAKKVQPGIKVKDVKQWLAGEQTYGVHFPYRAQYERSRIISAGIDYLWEMDLMDMVNLYRYNSGVRYVLLIIDVFSRFVWTCPVKSKRGWEILRGLKTIFRQSGRQPKYIRSDKGAEFVNKIVQDWLQNLGVKHIVTQTEVKAAIAERAIKTIKGKLYKYLYYSHKWRYIDVLNRITDTYNSTNHRSLGMQPNQVNKANEKNLWWRMYVSMDKVKPLRKGFVNVLDVGSYVRISFLRGPFDREYREKWSSEIFQIYKRFSRDGVLVYWLRDLTGEHLIGFFYREEILPVRNVPEVLYKIEKIVRQKTGPGGELLYLVKWQNWNNKFNSWVREEEIAGLR